MDDMSGLGGGGQSLPWDDTEDDEEDLVVGFPMSKDPAPRSGASGGSEKEAWASTAASKPLATLEEEAPPSEPEAATGSSEA